MDEIFEDEPSMTWDDAELFAKICLRAFEGQMEFTFRPTPEMDIELVLEAFERHGCDAFHMPPCVVVQNLALKLERARALVA